MEQVLGPVFGGSNRIWPWPIRGTGAGGFGFGTGAAGFFSQNLRDVAFSMASSIFILNLASTARLLPEKLFYFILRHLKSWLHQEINITIPEHARDFGPGDNMYFPDGSPSFRTNNNFFTAAETYIGAVATSKSNSLCTSLLRASTDRSGQNIVLTVDDSQVITDTFLKDTGPVLIKWRLHHEPVRKGINPSQSSNYQKKSFMLTFNGQKSGVQVVKEYLKHVMDTSEKMMSQNRQLRLYTNKTSMRMAPVGGHGMWDMVNFNHPSTFETFAMDPRRKREIMDDLEAFSKSQDYYAKIGKAWKRGYLLYGPPGTGKSTMIACIANYLKYDVYDLELTAVMDNTHLRQLMVNVPSKSIIVIEDIDCSLDLTGARKPVTSDDEQEEARMNLESRALWENGHMINRNKGKVTLSGLLNFIDGLWSTCGGERMVVFTTNHIDKLDPALIRKGRMDVHIELSYCKFEAFKLLSKNYLGVDEHPLYDKVKELLEEVEITPADVAEQLLPKNITAKGRTSESLEELIRKMEEIRDEKEQVKQLGRKH